MKEPTLKGREAFDAILILIAGCFIMGTAIGAFLAPIIFLAAYAVALATRLIGGH